MVLSKIYNIDNIYTYTVTQIDLWDIKSSDFKGKSSLLRFPKSFFSAYHFSASLHTQYIRLLLSHSQRGSFLPSSDIHGLQWDTEQILHSLFSLKRKGLSRHKQLGWDQEMQQKHHPPSTLGTNKTWSKLCDTPCSPSLQRGFCCLG